MTRGSCFAVVHLALVLKVCVEKEVWEFFGFSSESIVADVRGETVGLVSIHLLLDGCSSHRAVTWEVRAFGGWQAERGQRQSDSQNTMRPRAVFGYQIESWITFIPAEWVTEEVACFVWLFWMTDYIAVNDLFRNENFVTNYVELFFCPYTKWLNCKSMEKKKQQLPHTKLRWQATKSHNKGHILMLRFPSSLMSKYQKSVHPGHSSIITS